MAKKITVKKVIDEIKVPVGLIGGMIVGNFGGKTIDKLLKVNPALSGINPKSLAKPLVLLTAGVGGAMLLKDQNLKLVASGIAASGIASSVKILLKKDLLAGLDGLGETNDFLLSDNYDPELPELASAGYDSLEIEYPLEGANYEDYEEVQDVEIL